MVNLGDTVGKESEGLTSLTGIASSPSVSFETLVKESLCVVNERLNNTVYRIFLGKRVAYLVIENYVKNTCSKFGLVKSMMIKDMFFFKFRSKDGMESMLENEDRLSDIATKLSYPLLLDSYTAAMCTNYWGRASYARAMVELRAYSELKDTIVVVVPKFIHECLKKIVSDVLQNLKKPTQAIRGIPVKPKSNFIYRPVQTTKTKDKAPAKPKVTKATNYTTSTLDSFDALNTLVDEDNYGGMNPFSTQEPKQAEGHGKKDINTKRINKLKKQILDGKIMLVDDDGKPLNKADSDLVDSDSESDVEVAYDDTAQFMASGGANDASLYEDEDYDIYDTYEL
ncbi:hypothetical protein Tco_0725725 [Tanacetum coccineum]|uniref:Uncharacterized protein n=1 Tax=Tanacetum coccineum TaxID=301880 RepID=A0ABQ4YDR3_9ASTR